jgi:hypothetical protein
MLFGRRREPLVVLRRAGGTPPPDWEVLEVRRDGGFRMWRTIGRAPASSTASTASTKSTPVGRFAGTLPADDLAPLRAATDRCRRGGTVDLPPPLGGSVDTVLVGRSRLKLGDDQPAPDPWGPLTEHLRRLLGELTAFPTAALVLDRDQAGAAVHHLGAEALELDLAQGTVRVVRWADGAAVEESRLPLGGARSVTAGPGWSYPLPLGPDVAADLRLSLHIDDLLAFDGEFWRACALDSPPLV